jgi:hypothetical protein
MPSLPSRLGILLIVERFGLLNLSGFQSLYVGGPEGGSYHCDYVCSIYGKCNLGPSVTKSES